MDTPSPEGGKEQWSQAKGIPYPHVGWWSRAESLDTEVFDIKPLPNILSKLNSDRNASDTHVIILTSRQEKLRPQIENVLALNNIGVDEIVMKKGRDDKGDVILKYVEANPDLENVVVYDDFAGGMEDKIREFTKIKDVLADKGIEYNVIRVVDGRISNMVESSNILKFMIQDEILKFKS
jgi:hypothetical protein